MRVVYVVEKFALVGVVLLIGFQLGYSLHERGSREVAKGMALANAAGASERLDAGERMQAMALLIEAQVYDREYYYPYLALAKLYLEVGEPALALSQCEAGIERLSQKTAGRDLADPLGLSPQQLEKELSMARELKTDILACLHEDEARHGDARSESLSQEDE